MRRAATMGLAIVLAASLVGPARGASPLVRGGRVLAGSLTFSSAGGSTYAGDAGDRTQEWSVQPAGGLLVANGLAVNLLLSGTWFRQGDLVSNRYEMGPTLAYYFDTVGDDDAVGHAIPYLESGVLWGRAHSEVPGTVTSTNSTCVQVGGGLAWMLAERIAADISVIHRFGTDTQKEPLDGPRTHGNRWRLHWGLKVFLP